jgi:hypothetical protein
MAQSAKPQRVASIVDALKTHGLRAEDMTAIQATLDPLLIDEGEIHIHIEGDDTHIHVDIHDFE